MSPKLSLTTFKLCIRKNYIKCYIVHDVKFIIKCIMNVNVLLKWSIKIIYKKRLDAASHVMTMIINQSASISQEMSNYSARKFSLYMAAVVMFLRNENESGYA